MFYGNNTNQGPDNSRATEHPGNRKAAEQENTESQEHPNNEYSCEFHIYFP